jgi:hypothetical protein
MSVNGCAEVIKNWISSPTTDIGPNGHAKTVTAKIGEGSQSRFKV